MEAETATADPVATGAAGGTLETARWLADAGGPVVVVIGVMSVVALAIVVMKVVQFARLAAADRGTDEAVEAIARGGDPRQPAAFLATRRGPVGRVAHATVVNILGGTLTAAQAREEIGRVAAHQLGLLSRYLKGLETIVTLAPLLGLFGTILGMIEAFRQLEAVGTRADPTVLAGGIWEALLTTAAGLAVAIPAAAALSWLDSMVERTGARMEDAATRIATALAHHGTAENGLAKREDRSVRAAE